MVSTFCLCALNFLQSCESQMFLTQQTPVQCLTTGLIHNFVPLENNHLLQAQMWQMSSTCFQKELLTLLLVLQVFHHQLICQLLCLFLDRKTFTVFFPDFNLQTVSVYGRHCLKLTTVTNQSYSLLKMSNKHFNSAVFVSLVKTKSNTVSTHSLIIHFSKIKIKTVR